MGHRVNVWLQRLLAPGFAVTALIFLHFGFGALKVLALLLPLFIVLMIVLILLDPGPRAKAFVESLRNHPR